MFTFTPFVLAILASPLVLSAPTQGLDAQTLLQNGEDAQNLNAIFQNLTVNDACNNGDTACISGALAKCVNGQWQTKQCPSSLQCFALPSVKHNGTILSCTSERSALSIINATGAQGGISSLNSNTTSTNSSDCNGNSTSSANSTNNNTVTVTVTVGQQSSTSFSSQTTTISPDQAASLLSGIASGSSFTVVSTLSPSAGADAAAAAATTSTSVGSQSGASQAAATTILLTAAPADASQPTASSTDLAAAAAVTSPAASSPAGAGSGGGYY